MVDDGDGVSADDELLSPFSPSPERAPSREEVSWSKMVLRFVDDASFSVEEIGCSDDVTGCSDENTVCSDEVEPCSLEEGLRSSLVEELFSAADDDGSKLEDVCSVDDEGCSATVEDCCSEDEDGAFCSLEDDGCCSVDELLGASVDFSVEELDSGVELEAAGSGEGEGEALLDVLSSVEDDDGSGAAEDEGGAKEGEGEGEGV